MNIDNMTIRAKLATAFGVLAILVLLVAGWSLKSLMEANDRFEKYVHGVNARAMMAGSVRTAALPTASVIVPAVSDVIAT